jgi:spermidine synthase
VLLPLLAVYWNNKKALAVFSGCGVASLVAVFLCTQNSIWSPYQRIDTAPSYHWEIGDKQIMRPYPVGTQILVNHNPHQRMIDLSDKFLSEHPEQQTGNEVRYFNIPYIVGKQAHDVLILGAGTGNDVSAAVRHGATHIDAVEIDPALQALGKLTHPEHPYQSPAVNVHIDDARAFLGRTQNKYDTIVLGMLDSQTALSTMSSVRLDNYLYTVDCLRSLTQHLTPDGVAFVSFATQSDWLRSRFYQMIKTASGGQEPVALKVRVACPGSITVAWGPGLPGVKAQIEKQFPEMIAPPSTLMTSVELPTDDWPFIYQQYRSLPLVSVFMLISVLGISALMITGRFKLRPQEFVGNLQFFLLGAGFLLMETRAMLAGALLLGSTWTINTAIIALVLIMALIANAIVIRAKWVTVNHAYGALIAALLVMYFFDLHMMTQWALPAKLLGGALVLGTPFLCSGIVFARAFKNTTQPNVALGINVLGAIVGGLLEYSSVVVGSNNLVLLAIALYVAAFLSAKNPSKV